MYLVGTHDELRSTYWLIATWGAELVRSGRTAGAEQVGHFLVYVYCTPESHGAPFHPRVQPGTIVAAHALASGARSRRAHSRFRPAKIPANIEVTPARFAGNPEEIAAKEVTRGRHHQDRRQAGTQEAETRRPQKGRTQGKAHRSARRKQEKGEEDGSRSLQ